MLPLNRKTRGLRAHRPTIVSYDTKTSTCPLVLPGRIAPAPLSPGLFPCLNTPSGISKPGLRALRISRAGARDCAVLSTYISRWSWGSSSATANKTATKQQPKRLVEPFAVADATRMSASYMLPLFRENHVHTMALRSARKTRKKKRPTSTLIPRSK